MWARLIDGLRIHVPQLEQAGHFDVASVFGSFFDRERSHGEIAIESGSFFEGEFFAGNGASDVTVDNDFAGFYGAEEIDFSSPLDDDAVTGNCAVDFTGLANNEVACAFCAALNLAFDGEVVSVNGDAGDVATFTIEVEHSANTTAPAYDLVIEDQLGAGLTLLPGSVLINGAAAPDGVLVSENGILQINVAVLLPGESLTITYQTLIDNSVGAGDILTNEASLTFDSAAGPGGRAQTLDDQENITVTGTPTFSKVIVSTSLEETGDGEFDPTIPDVTVGEQITYQLVVTLPEGTTSVSLTDQLPVGGGVISLDARHVDHTHGTPQQRDAGRDHLRHCLIAALGNRARAIRHTFAAL